MNSVSGSSPQTPGQRLHRAKAAQRRGDLAVAAALYRELTRDYPDFPDAWHYYGLLLHLQGEDEPALQCLDHAERLVPDHPDFLCNYGSVLLEIEQPREAYERLRRARRMRPDDIKLLILLAQAVLALSAGELAIADLERALRREGDNWQLWLLLGRCREQIGNRTGALDAFTEAVLFAPETATLPHMQRGMTALASNEDEKARAAYSVLLRKLPESAEARLGFATLAAREGDFERAETLAREALERDPASYTAWTLLASLRKDGDAPFNAELERAAAAAGEDPQAIPLHFAHARSLENLGRYDEAFAAYELGNGAQGRKAPYQREGQEAVNDDLIGALDADFVARGAAIGIPEARPIFVCGMPRSGTTLVETILASHPEVGAGGEMRYIHDYMLSRLGLKGIQKGGSWLRERSDAELREMAANWRRALDKAGNGKPYVTDKMPGNYTVLGFIQVCFPNARIVHVHRDPRDTCFSCYATLFHEAYTFSYALDSLGHYYRLYEAMVEHWRRVLGKSRIIDVEYETLVADPEAETRRLLDAVGLAWHPGCLEFYKTRRSVGTASLHQVRQPLYSSSVGRWRHFERHLGPLVEALGMTDPL